MTKFQSTGFFTFQVQITFKNCVLITSKKYDLNIVSNYPKNQTKKKAHE